MNLNVFLDTNLKVREQLNRSIMAPKEKGGYFGPFLDGVTITRAEAIWILGTLSTSIIVN